MCKLVRFRKKFLIKCTAISTVLCLMAGSLSMYAYADEKTDNIKSSENESVNQDNSEGSTKDTDTKKTDNEEDKSVPELKENNKSEENTQNKDKGDNSGSSIDDNPGKEEKYTVSGNDIAENDVSGNDIGSETKAEVTEINEYEEIPEIVNVVVPTAYTLALNPYGLSIKTGGNKITTEQIISGTYGIVNKSSTDQIVTVSLTIEDRNGDKLVFVDSAEEAENAEEGVYAIYLEAVPANEEQILIGEKPVDKDVTGESLRKVEMTAAEEHAVALRDGTNKIAFKLSGAVYNDDNELMNLAPDGKGVSAYTFSGVMNSNAEWEKLSGGIKLSVVYTYQTAEGNEEIIEGTGAMIQTD